MDGLAAKGEVGNVVNCPAGLPAGSDTAILSIFGADPNVCYTGRSPLEAAATGIQLQPGDISYRCNMVTYEDSDLPFEEKRILSHSGGSIEGNQSIQLITDLFRDPAFQQAAQQAGMVVHPAASFRHIAVQSGASITGISLLPPHDHLGEVIGPLLPSGNDNAQVLKSLMKLAHQVLDHHPINEQRRAEGKRPANGVWFWAEGSAVALESFWEKYHKTGTVISALPLCFGIAVCPVWIFGRSRAPRENWIPTMKARLPPPWRNCAAARTLWPSTWRPLTSAPTTGTSPANSRPSSGWTAGWLGPLTPGHGGRGHGLPAAHSLRPQNPHRHPGTRRRPRPLSAL